ncbi:MAG: prolipoprotein diacylglyceryl transferase [Ignavibacteria bacterium]|nr:prolipoprotein diacylglyceryl transferase [Ignavibacteria bacterium]
MIEWNVDPIIFTVGPLQPRWYGLLFALAFVVSYQIMRRLFLDDKRSMKDLEALAITMIVSTVLGARLGHVIFYEPNIFFQDPLEVLAVWHGGLASHGGTIGIIIGLWWFQRKRKSYSMIWLLDRLAIVSAISGMFIRIGNLFNSEIIGMTTDVPWAFWFKRVDTLPVARHPAQIYEALLCLGVFILLWILYKKRIAFSKPGVLIGVFFVVIFTGRFIIEFFKERQEAFEAALPIDMGQILSIPFIVIGVWMLTKTLTQRTNS